MADKKKKVPEIANKFDDVVKSNQVGYEDFIVDLDNSLGELSQNILDSGVRKVEGKPDFFGVRKLNGIYKVSFLGTADKPLEGGVPVMGFTKDEYVRSGRSFKTADNFFTPGVNFPSVLALVKQAENGARNYMSDEERSKYDAYCVSLDQAETKEEFVVN